MVLKLLFSLIEIDKSCLKKVFHTSTFVYAVDCLSSYFVLQANSHYLNLLLSDNEQFLSLHEGNLARRVTVKLTRTQAAMPVVAVTAMLVKKVLSVMTEMVKIKEPDLYMSTWHVIRHMEESP